MRQRTRGPAHSRTSRLEKGMRLFNIKKTDSNPHHADTDREHVVKIVVSLLRVGHVELDAEGLHPAIMGQVIVGADNDLRDADFDLEFCRRGWP